MSSRSTAYPQIRRSAVRVAQPGNLLVAGILLLFLVAGSAAVDAQSLPRPRGFVNDFAGVVSAEDERVMTQIIEAIQRETGAEIAVIVVDTLAPYASIEQFTIAVAESWGVGSSRDDSGVIIAVAVQERRLRIEVGYGLEGAITDGTAGRIRDDYIVPYLSENQWGEGLKAGVGAVAVEIAEEYNLDLDSLNIAAPARPASSRGSSRAADIGDFIYYIFIFVFIIGGRFFWPLLFLGRRRRGFFGGGFGSMHRGSSHSSRGFSGFGGGGFGGGGASGSF